MCIGHYKHTHARTHTVAGRPTSSNEVSPVITTQKLHTELWRKQRVNTIYMKDLQIQQQFCKTVRH